MHYRFPLEATRWAARLAPLALIALLAPALGGCFISETPLISTGHAVFPFQRLVYKSVDSDDIVTLVRHGDVYSGTSQNEPDTMEFLFKSLAADTYLAQVKEVSHGKPVYYYGYVVVDDATKIARAYKIVAGEKEEGAGLRRCNGDNICIDRLDDYRAFVEKAIAGGETPEGEFRILGME